jgi:hypothetical protein
VISDLTRSYAVYESSAFGTVRLAAEVDATSDSEALAEARRLMPAIKGELRQGPRVVCRFGRAG